MVEASNSNTTDLQKTGNLAVCQLCSKKGHIASVCHSKPSEPVLPTCQLWNRVGHTADKCPPLAIATQGERSKACQRCGRTGHVAENCLSLSKDADGQGLQISSFVEKEAILQINAFQFRVATAAYLGICLILVFASLN